MKAALSIHLALHGGDDDCQPPLGWQNGAPSIRLANVYQPSPYSQRQRPRRWRSLDRLSHHHSPNSTHGSLRPLFLFTDGVVSVPCFNFVFLNTLGAVWMEQASVFSFSLLSSPSLSIHITAFGRVDTMRVSLTHLTRLTHSCASQLNHHGLYANESTLPKAWRPQPPRSTSKKHLAWTPLVSTLNHICRRRSLPCLFFTNPKPVSPSHPPPLVLCVFLFLSLPCGWTRSILLLLAPFLLLPSCWCFVVRIDTPTAIFCSHDFSFPNLFL